MEKKQVVFGCSLLFMLGILSLITMSNSPVEIEGLESENLVFVPRISATYYYCYNQSDIENAITSIGTGEGIIVLANDTIELSSSIYLRNGGNYTFISYIGTIVDILGNFAGFDVGSSSICSFNDFTVNASSLTGSFVFFITPTTNQAIFNNVTLIGNGGDGIGISSNSVGIVIKNCIISKFDCGIYIDGGNVNILSDNVVSNNDFGIVLTSSDNSMISNNTCDFNTNYGIRLTSSNYCNITENNCSNNDHGISLLNNNDNTIQGNNCSYNDYGIYLDSTNNSIIESNECNNNSYNGIYVYQCSSSNISENELRYNGWIYDSTGLYTSNSVGIIINNNKILHSGDAGLSLANVNNSEIKENLIHNNTRGISLNQCNLNQITENNLTDNERGILMNVYCYNNSIISNNISFSSWIGISLETFVEGNSITDNLIYNCSEGITLYEASMNNVTLNTCYNGAGYGIFLEAHSDDNWICNNTCFNNTLYGINIQTFNSERNFLIMNNCTNNSVNYFNGGTDTYFEMYCAETFQIQEALDLIASDTGKIILAATTFILTKTIEVNGSGTYVIEGQGDDTIIDCISDITTFNITNTSSCDLQNFNINASQVSNERSVLFINETNHNEIMVNEIGITGNQRNSIGVIIYSGNVTIIGCTFNELNTSISVIGGNNNKIIGSYFSENFYCITFIPESDDSSYNQIKDNVLTNSSKGIIIAGVYGTTGFNTISGNVIQNLNDNITTSAGIFFIGTHHNNISRNILINNVVNYSYPYPSGAIYLGAGCHNNTIESNYIANNYNLGTGWPCHGICIGGGGGGVGDNLIYNNTIIGNQKQATDDFIYNSWNNSEIGNFWGDYNGVDFDFDGIGDIPYHITGSIYDYLPIWNSNIQLLTPLNASIVSQYPPSFSVIFHDPNVNCTWYSLDGGLHNYSFTGDFTIDANAWEILWEDYSDGDPIIITFYFNTTYGYIVEKSFTLYGQYIHPPDYTLLIIGLIISGVSIMGVSTILIMRNKIKNRPKKWTPSEDQVGEDVVEGRLIEYDDV